MSLLLKIQSKAEAILESEAAFYGVNATAIAKAIIDKVVCAGHIRDVLQGVDVASYQERRRYRDHGKPVYLFRGAHRTLKDIQEITGVSSVLIKNRLDRGWKLERAATTPSNTNRRRQEAQL